MIRPWSRDFIYIIMYRRILPLTPSSPPPLKLFFPTPNLVRTPLPHKSPRPVPHNRLHTSLLSHQMSQTLRPRLPRKIPSRIRIQPLIDDALSRPRILHPSQNRIRIKWVGRRSDSAAICEDLAAQVPCREENAGFEGLTGGGRQLAVAVG